MSIPDMAPITYRCSHCGAPILDSEAWEYADGAPSVRTPERDKRRIHSRCVAQLVCEALALYARVPDEELPE